MQIYSDLFVVFFAWIGHLRKKKKKETRRIPTNHSFPFLKQSNNPHSKDRLYVDVTCPKIGPLLIVAVSRNIAWSQWAEHKVTTTHTHNMLLFKLELACCSYNCPLSYTIVSQRQIYNHFHNILRLFDVLPNFGSPQVKRWEIITYKHGIYDLPHEL